MEIMEIIKESLRFPINNMEAVAIYLVLSFAVGLLSAGGVLILAFSSGNAGYLAIGVILLIIGVILSFIISGYQVSILKSGIDLDEDAPSFDWKNNFIMGIKSFIVHFVYFIIPAIIVLIVALITNVIGNISNIIQESGLAQKNATVFINSPEIALNAVSKSTMAAFGTSILITAGVALVVFIIFAFISLMGQARLANTGSLADALNIPDAAKDPIRIGIGKVIAVVILTLIIVAVIEAILGYIYGQIPQLTILSIIITPFIAFFTQRAYGLLYSDIS